MRDYRNKNELTIEDIHSVTLKLVEKLIQICDDVGVNYYVAYGSLIGVVRHKGFIPWDDDFDVVMLRDDYETYFSSYLLFFYFYGNDIRNFYLTLSNRPNQ